MPRRTSRKAIEKVSRDIAAIEASRSAATILTPARAEFLSIAESRGKIALHTGWPDFVVEDPSSGAVVAVKVVRDTDQLTPAHERMFTMLEHGRVHVYIWNPRYPHTLTPWRRWSLEPRRAPRDPVGRTRSRRRPE